MSNYTQIVSFGPKDSLNTGDAAKKIKGTEIDAEFAAISTAIGTKEDTANKGAASGYCPLNSSSQIADAYLPATLLKAGTAATVTAAWVFEGSNTQTGTLALNGNTTVGASTVLRRGTLGSFLSHAASGNTSGVVTVSTSGPTGGANGDIWLKV